MLLLGSLEEVRVYWGDFRDYPGKLFCTSLLPPNLVVSLSVSSLIPL